MLRFLTVASLALSPDLFLEIRSNKRKDWRRHNYGGDTIESALIPMVEFGSPVGEEIAHLVPADPIEVLGAQSGDREEHHVLHGDRFVSQTTALNE